MMHREFERLSARQQKKLMEGSRGGGMATLEMLVVPLITLGVIIICAFLAALAA